ncbi:PREDICTED: GTPase-activating protein gyp7-like [Tarenaya hassleriana]|uniref:GTPase-activating protein gyp7-like n=1 Tax=Tarenaya hassleriana TaxID=28532 RepID=UPI00053C769F|nr:PREDICTED: GTPase-activating protein gyp7-like [Tarenaya hassleriana]
MKALRRSHTSTSSGNPTFSASSSSSWTHLRSVLFVANPSSQYSTPSSDRSRRKSPWSRRKRKPALTPQQWKSLFTPEGKFRDGGVGFLKKVRSRGVDSSIRPEVWLFLLGVYDLNSSGEEREVVRTEKRKEYEKLQRQCRMLLTCCNGSNQNGCNGNSSDVGDDRCCPEEATESPFGEINSHNIGFVDEPEPEPWKDISAANSESSDSDSSEDPEDVLRFPSFMFSDERNREKSPEIRSEVEVHEDFSTWQRIIRLDALRADSEWATYSPKASAVTESRARRSAESVGLKDYDHLEPCRLFHAARLVAILEAYALYDPEIGYCQGMSDLLSPIMAVITDDHEAFWCFVGFMKKARHNFRLDEAGIQRQLNLVSRIIKCKDSQLYKHLENLQAEDCSFVYRMVLVMFRRELTFEQTLCLWEVMWADQAAIRAGVGGKSPWSRIRQQAPPTDDLLLYAIAALVLRRKLIIQKYNSMDEIVEECNSMAGHLDVWKLLDDAHHLVVILHDKIGS